jgi:O-antigen/teichoic acid export membrane protein
METGQDAGIFSKEAKQSNTFARDIIWVSTAQLFASLIFGVATLPVLTKHYTTEFFGIWAQIIVTVPLLSGLFAMELDMAVVRFLSGERDVSRRRTALGTMLFAIVVFSILAYFVVNSMATQFSIILFASPQYTTFVRLTLLWVITDAIFIFLSSYFRSRGKIRLLSIRQLIYSSAIMVIAITISSLSLGLEWVIGCIIAVQGILVITLLIMIVKEIGWPVPNVTGLKSYLAFSLPQIPAVALLWLIEGSDRYFITHFLGLSQSGIFTSSAQLATVTRLFYSPICYVLYPALSRLWDEERLPEVKNYLQHSTRLLLTLGIPAATGIALLSQPILKLLTTSEFLAGKELVFLVSLGIVFLGVFQINQQIILLKKKTKLLPLLIAVASVVSIVMNIILIPRIGIIGAAISNVAAYFVLAAFVTIMASKSIHYSLDLKFLVKVVGATVLMAVCLYFLKTNNVWDIIKAVIVGASVFGAGLILFRVFSKEDTLLITQILKGLIPDYVRKITIFNKKRVYYGEYIRRIKSKQASISHHIFRKGAKMNNRRDRDA